MSKHTEGPWFVTGHMTKYVEARIGGGIIQEVAAVGPTDADGGYGSQQEANARLIAAAPDLLEALEEISDPIRFMKEGLEEGERLNGMAAVQLAEDASYLRGIARAAIAKATGGQL